MTSPTTSSAADGGADPRSTLRGWLNRNMRVTLSDGRVLVGIFLCTDRDSNVILGSCTECLSQDDERRQGYEPRILGLAMVPGKHIVSIKVDEDCNAPVPMHKLA